MWPGQGLGWLALNWNNKWPTDPQHDKTNKKMCNKRRLRSACPSAQPHSDHSQGGGCTPILGQYGCVPPESPPFLVWAAPKDSSFFYLDRSKRHIWPKTCTTFHPLAFVTSYMALVTKEWKVVQILGHIYQKTPPPLLKQICFFVIFSFKFPLVFQWGAALKATHFQWGTAP